MDMSDLPRPAAPVYRVLPVRERRAGQWREVQDCVAEEVPVALEFNGVSHAVMMATPDDLEDFAYGFSITEGIVDRASQIYDCECASSDRGYTVHLTIAASCFHRLKAMRRNLTGRTGCGLCGTESLDHAVRTPQPVTARSTFDTPSVTRAVAGLRTRQLLLAATGATHAAAWCTAEGEIALLREDVGRHNALDKLAGALIRSRCRPEEGFVVVTSRASYEMVQKTAALGVSLLVAVSGVTALAADLAQDAGVTLIGFARGDDVSIYSHPERLKLDAQ